MTMTFPLKEMFPWPNRTQRKNGTDGAHGTNAIFSGDSGDTSANILTKGTISPAPENGFNESVLFENGIEAVTPQPPQRDARGLDTGGIRCRPVLSSDFVGGQDAGAAEPGNARADGPCGRPACSQGIDDGRSNSYGVAGHRQSVDPAPGVAQDAPGHFCGQDLTGGFEPGAARAVPSIDAQSIPSHGAGLGQSSQPAIPQKETQGTKVVTADDIITATKRKAALEAFRTLRKASVPNKKAARKVGVPYMTLYWWGKAFDARGFDGLLPGKSTGRKPKLKLTPQEVSATKAIVLQTNRTFRSGSNPEALRVAIKRGLLHPDTVAMLNERAMIGAPVTDVIRNQLRISEVVTRASRAPRETWVEEVQSPGSLYLTRDQVTGEEREIEPGERGTMDDGTVNFVGCVPFNLPGNKCSEKFGVMVGRFQVILPVDHRSHFIPGYNHTSRPRSSYRAEDLTATLHTIFVEHGYWEEMTLEKGISASKLLTDTLRRLGIRIVRANSPHEKVVEGVFNKLWTKLSLQPGQVGRYQGEEEKINALILSCRAGATDPRKYFPMLADILKALKEAITEHNEQLIISRQYGRWIPREMFERMASKRMRKLEPEQAWLFSPVITDPLTVRGCKVRKSVCLVEGSSEVFDFSAPWMHDYAGALVKLYFNPFAPDCIAMVELAQDFAGQRAGKILGHAEQINWMTRFRRRAMGYGEDPDIGRDATARNAQALRRSVVAIRTDGTVGAQTHEARNGVGDSEMATNIQAPAPKIQTQRQRAAGVSQDEFERQAAKLKQEAEWASAAPRQHFGSEAE